MPLPGAKKAIRHMQDSPPDSPCATDVEDDDQTIKDPRPLKQRQLAQITNPATQYNEDSSWRTHSMTRRRATVARRELHDQRDEQQLRTFTRWWNSWLVEVGLHVEDLCEEVKHGVITIKLLEVLSDSTCGSFNREPKTKYGNAWHACFPQPPRRPQRPSQPCG